MYRPQHFVENRADVMHELMRRHPLATIVTRQGDALEADHVPLLMDTATGRFGTLRGHVARANPLWRSVADGAEVLAIFQGADFYVSPAWYPSKLTDARVVPTWNYAVVHARGVIEFRHDRDWLAKLVTRLTDTYESRRNEPWQVSDAPGDFIDAMLHAIVGFEITITALDGKWKMSQNRSDDDRAGVAKGRAAESAVNSYDERASREVE